MYATGWLGWSDHDAIMLPVPRILLALDGYVEAEKTKANLTAAAVGRLFSGAPAETPPKPDKAQATADLAAFIARASKHST